MTSHRARLSLVIALTGLAFLSSAAHAQVYPSAGTFWVTGNDPPAPTDENTQKELGCYPQCSKEDVVKWQAHHADFSAWGGYNYRSYVPDMVVLDYILAGNLMDYGYYPLEAYLCQTASRHGHDCEDFHLHYQTDTWMNITQLYQNAVPWAGVPAVVGYTSSSNDQDGVLLSGTGPWPPAQGDIFQGVTQGGAFYLANPDSFAEATLIFTLGGLGNGPVTVEYASHVDGQFHVDRWTPLNLTFDGTHNFSRSGTIKWLPPRDWIRGFNPVPKQALFPVAHWLRIKGTGYVRRPVLETLNTRAWIGVDFSGPHQGFVKIPGWDPANDKNNDGYVDDAEYADLHRNTSANARFRYESRVALISQYFAADWAISVANTADCDYQDDLAELLTSYCSAEPCNGGYNDNLFFDFNSWLSPIVAGGQLVPEGDIQGVVPSDATILAYKTGLLATLAKLKFQTGTHWMGANTGYINPYDWHPWAEPYPALGRAIVNSNVFDWILLEGTLKDSYPMVDAEYAPWVMDGGLSTLWQVPAYAQAGVKSAFMARIDPWLVTYPTTQAVFERSQMAILAQYYLYHFAGLTALHCLAYNYGDLGVLTTTDNYYKEGVPKNYAYQPHEMLEVDIGTPAGLKPPGYPAMQYTAEVDGTGGSNHTVVGVSTDTSLSHPKYGQIPVEPTNTYYLAARDCAPGCPPYTRLVKDPTGYKFPAEVVLARHYTKGLVLFRTSFSYPVDQNNNPDYKDYASDANEISVTLPCTYRQVNFDGTLAPPSNQITLHGFEGAVLFNPAPVIITSPVVTSGYFGRLFGYQITATNSPTIFGASGLPGGLRVDTTTGLISGLPRARGAFQVGLSATNVDGTGTATLQITVR